MNFTKTVRNGKVKGKVMLKINQHWFYGKKARQNKLVL